MCTISTCPSGIFPADFLPKTRINRAHTSTVWENLTGMVASIYLLVTCIIIHFIFGFTGESIDGDVRAGRARHSMALQVCTRFLFLIDLASAFVQLQPLAFPCSYLCLSGSHISRCRTASRPLFLSSPNIPENRNKKSFTRHAKIFNATSPTTGSIRKSPFDYNNEITALGSSGKWKDALALLDKMIEEGRPMPNVITYNAVMSALMKNGEWNQTLQVFKRLRTSGLSPDTRSYSVAISACSKGQKWQKAVELLSEMESVGVKPNEFTYR